MVNIAGNHYFDQLHANYEVFMDTHNQSPGYSEQKERESMLLTSKELIHRGNMRKLPFLGRIYFVNDSFGILQFCFIVAYWLYVNLSALWIIIIPRYHDGYIPLVFIIFYVYLSAMTVISLFQAATTNPGSIPSMDDTVHVSDAKDWTYCRICLRRRPLRTHHCSRCRQCVVRMDHHCPWINNCVGMENHFIFLLLLFYAFLLSLTSFVICMLHHYYYPKCVHCDKEAFYIKHSIWFIYLSTVLAANMFIFMFCQLVMQHINIITNRTTLDNMIQPLPQTLNFRNMLDAYSEMFGTRWMVLWLFPCRRRQSTSLGGCSTMAV